MSIRERLSGNEAVAFAMKQINPDAVYLAEKEYGALRRRSIELDMNQKMEEDIYG